jgi:hypothetical protein
VREGGREREREREREGSERERERERERVWEGERERGRRPRGGRGAGSGARGRRSGAGRHTNRVQLSRTLLKPLLKPGWKSLAQCIAGASPLTGLYVRRTCVVISEVGLGKVTVGQLLGTPF